MVRRREPNLAKIYQETNSFLADGDKELDALNRYPLVKKLFLKYNTPLPSSAPAERLFSFGGIVNRARRQKLRDDHLEMLVLKKANSLANFK